MFLDVNEQNVCRAAADLDKSGKRTKGYVCDVADKSCVDKVFGEVEETWGKIDILINNAGITRDGMFHKMEEEQWDLVMDVNLASVSAFGNMGQTNYGASKAAVIGFTKCLAKESGEPT